MSRSFVLLNCLFLLTRPKPCKPMVLVLNRDHYPSNTRQVTSGVSTLRLEHSFKDKASCGDFTISQIPVHSRTCINQFLQEFCHCFALVCYFRIRLALPTWTCGLRVAYRLCSSKKLPRCSHGRILFFRLGVAALVNLTAF